MGKDAAMGQGAVRGQEPTIPPSPPCAWFVYMLRCADGSLYTGITTDPLRRVAEHNAGGSLGARYTRGRRPVELIYTEPADNRSSATSREAELKRLARKRKLALVMAGTDPR